MANYKDMIKAIESLVSRNRPFLIIKYSIVFGDRANNAYEIVTGNKRRLCYAPLTRSDALYAINKFNIPLLYKLDNRNMIWGDERFKDKFNKLKGVGYEKF